MRSILAALAILVPSSVFAASGGVFCKGTMVLIARPEGDNSLTFRIMGSDPRQNIIEVEGNAAVHGRGWRYQVTSPTVPEDRCTLDFRASGGGYSIKSVEGARCESSGGYGAYEMLMRAEFPASSVVPGVAPPRGKVDDVAEFDCARKRFFAAATPPAAASGVIGAAPVGVVRGLIMQDTGGWGQVFAERPTPVMTSTFTAAFNRSWANAMTHNQQEPVLDGDPITGYQGVTRVVERSTDGAETNPTTAKVTAELSVTAGGETKVERVFFNLKLEDRHWKIDDIQDQDTPSLRNYFHKNYGL